MESEANNKQQMFNKLFNNKNIKQLREIAKTLQIKKYSIIDKTTLTNKIVEKQLEEIEKNKLQDQFEEQQYNNIDSDISMLTKQNVLREALTIYQYINNSKTSPEDILYNLFPKFNFIFKNFHKHSFKAAVVVKAYFTSSFKDETQHWFLRSKVYNKFDSNFQQKIIADINNAVENKDTQNSGWKLDYVDFVNLEIHRTNQSEGSSYIELPENIKNKTAILNIKNTDNRCFIYSVLAHLYPNHSGNDNNPTSYTKHFSKLNISMLQYPVQINDRIRVFEKENNLIINIFCLENEDNSNSLIAPCRLSPILTNYYKQLVFNMEQAKTLNLTSEQFEKFQSSMLETMNQTNIINLFLYKGHYMLIKSFSRLISKQISKCKSKFHTCLKCLYHTSSDNFFINHLRFCSNNNITYTKLPTQDNNKLYFKNHQKSIRVPFSVYADFESILKPVEENHPLNSEQRKVINTHIPSAYAFHIVSPLKSFKPHIYLGENADTYFVDDLLKTLVTGEESVYNKHFKNRHTNFPVPKDVSTDATHCHICEKPFEPDDKRVIDHCHFTGEFRGIAHNNCNVNYKDPNFIPIFLHNMSHYDSHLFIKAFSKHPQLKIEPITQTEETYISIAVKVPVGTFFNKKTQQQQTYYFELRFLDSFKFMSSSLDSLSQNLEKFPILEQFYPDQKLLQKKGVYPYEYMSSFDRFNETELPSIESFYSNLNLQGITEAQYNHAKTVWNHFNIKNLGQYTNLYLLTDVLLLADVFETFRDTCLKYYKLDPAQYYTAPGLSWDALLKSTNQTLELITDQRVLEFFEQQVRGGISMITHRYAKANNPYLPNYDETQPKSYITYQDVNNLYGFAMSQKLPTGNLKWLTEVEVNKLFNILTTNPNSLNLESNIGYTLEVDVEYPTNLHDYHNDYPFLPEALTINNVKKLTPNLANKYHYHLNIKNLVQAINHGLILKKIHAVISYNQSHWMKPYIDMNTKLRAEAKNEFEKNFFKLMNNSVFGKTMENVRNRSNIFITNNETQLIKHQTKPTFLRATTFNDSLVAVHHIKLSVFYNKPIYVGAQILDISKTLMYNYHYNYFKPKFPNSKLLFTDCDSLPYHIYTDDFYKDISEDCKTLFNTSGQLNPRVPLGLNKKVIGLLKDEANDDTISEFVGLRPKLYSFVTNNDYNNTTKKAKGVKKSVINKTISFKDYFTVMMNNTPQNRTIPMFYNQNHTIYTINQEKVALDGSDDKRYVLSDKISTFALNHWRLSN